MTAVERVLDFSNLKTEEDDKNSDLEDEWPKKGEIIFENVSFSYREQSRKVLDCLNFKIISKEKIGIIGQTAAGLLSQIYFNS